MRRKARRRCPHGISEDPHQALVSAVKSRRFHPPIWNLASGLVLLQLELA
jgi:hypothetical protein